MNLQNGYKVLYERVSDGKRTFFASKTGVFADAEQIGEAIEIGKYKLIYEKNGKIYCSESGAPTEEDTCVESFNEILVKADEKEEAENEEPHAEAIATNNDSYGTLEVDGSVVTLTAAGTVKWLKSSWGTFGNWVGFKINVPEGVDAATAIYTRPNGKSSMLSEVLDPGKNYASVYSDMSKYGDTATYYLDWNGDGVNDLTVIIDASKATLESEPIPEVDTEAEVI